MNTPCVAGCGATCTNSSGAKVVLCGTCGLKYFDELEALDWPTPISVFRGSYDWHFWNADNIKVLEGFLLAKASGASTTITQDPAWLGESLCAIASGEHWTIPYLRLETLINLGYVNATGVRLTEAGTKKLVPT